MISDKPCQTARPSPICIKQNVLFQVGISSEKFQLNETQNGQLSAKIICNMPDIGQTITDSYTKPLYQNVWFQVEISSENFNSIKFKMAEYWPWLTLVCVISDKPCQIAGPLH